MVVSFLAIFLLRDVMQGHTLIRMAVAQHAQTNNVQIDPDTMPAKPSQYPAEVAGTTTAGKPVTCTIKSLSFNETPACVAADGPSAKAPSAETTIQMVSVETVAALSKRLEPPAGVVEALGLRLPSNAQLTKDPRAEQAVKDKVIAPVADVKAKEGNKDQKDKKTGKVEASAQQSAADYPFIADLLNGAPSSDFFAAANVFTARQQERHSMAASYSAEKAKVEKASKATSERDRAAKADKAKAHKGTTKSE